MRGSVLMRSTFYFQACGYLSLWHSYLRLSDGFFGFSWEIMDDWNDMNYIGSGCVLLFAVLDSLLAVFAS
jgi:hypothetical protein